MTRSINKANVLKTERIDRFGYATVAGGRPVLAWSKVAGGDSLSYSYDSFGQVRTVDGPRSPEQVFYRSANPSKVDSVTTGGFTMRMHYDTLGRDTLITDAAGTAPSPGTSGVVSSVGHTTRKLYDTVFGNLTRVEEPGDRFSGRVFDKYGRDSVVFSNGTARRYVTYDAIDRPVRDSLSADPKAITYDYDKEFLLRVSDAKGQVFRREVNALGWPTRVYDPADTLGKYVSYFYDRGGHVAGWTNQRLQRQDIGYDQLGRPTSTSSTGNFALDSWTHGYRYATYPIDSTTAVTGTFTVARNEISVDTTWTDSFGWVDSVVTRIIAGAPQGLNASIAQKRFVRYHVPTPDRQLDSTYYKAMAVGSSTNLIPFVSRRYVRDLTTGATGTYVLGVSGVANNVNVSYDPNELIERYRDYPSSVRHSFAYTPRHEVAQSFYNSATLEAAFGRTYAFRDSLGRVTSMSWSLGPDTTNVRSFRFNDRGELVRLADSTVAAATCSFTGQDLLNGLSCTGGTAWPTRVLTFAYDSAGNLTGETDSLASTTTAATYTLGNRLTAFGTTTYTLDDDGNIASRTTGGATTYFTYDGKSRLASVLVGADTTFYWYNANGELTVRARNNNSGANVRTIERLFFWDGGQLVAETDAGMTTRYGEYAYLPGVDRPLALITTDSSVSGNTLVRYYQQDELGNVIGLTSGSTVAQQITYEPWGAVAAITGGALADTSRLRWKGLLWEGGATQLYYVRNRWYDPMARRFISQDPIGIGGGLNQYALAGNDPVNGADPSGLCPRDEATKITFTPTENGEWAETRICSSGGFSSHIWVGGNPLTHFSKSGGLTGSQAEAAILGVGVLLTPAQPVLEGIASAELALISGGMATARSTVTVVGNYPKYLNVARGTGAHAFNIGEGMSTALGDEGTWALNWAYLRWRMLLGDSFHVSFSSPGTIWAGGRVGPWLSREVQLFLSGGYRRVGSWFVRP
ncbi:MAG TPA: RHS repeat-associated core domain-containing protein [Gemmatimonadaceae bacterium]|nr:RHS repeat-associated core domain-containing protein [Gemmatimonadaceae bacterium]